MGASQRKDRVVIECRGRPGGSRVTKGAFGWESSCNVVGTGRVCEIGPMAGITIHRRAFEDVIDMARGACKRGMCAGERVSRVFQVVELGVKPGVHRVAAFACGWEAGRDMIKLGGQKILLMAGVAGG